MKSLGARIVLFFVTLLVLVQGLAAFLVSRSNEQIARKTIEQAIDQGELSSSASSRRTSCASSRARRSFSADFAIREAIATKNTATIQSMLRNHGGRIGAT
jgi:hypothetical protein